MKQEPNPNWVNSELPAMYWKGQFVPLTFWQRFQYWWSGVWSAMKEKPPKSDCIFVECKPEESTFTSTFIKGPRYKVVDGEYRMVKEE